VTVSFGGPADDRSRHQAIEKAAREAMRFLQAFGAADLVVFAPSKTQKIMVAERLRVACEFYNHLGGVAAEYGFRAGLHNHLDQIVETRDEIELFLKLTDPKRFHFAPDTAHAHLAGCDVADLFAKHADRISFTDYKDARNTPARQDIRLGNGRVLPAGLAAATFFSSIYDLGEGEIDFPAAAPRAEAGRVRRLDLSRPRLCPGERARKLRALHEIRTGEALADLLLNTAPRRWSYIVAATGGSEVRGNATVKGSPPIERGGTPVMSSRQRERRA